MANPMIQMFNATKVYDGGKAAIKDVTLEIQKGEMVFITGPSGAGKTTLIKLITCEETLSTGQILVDRLNLRRLPGWRIPGLRRKMGVVFQDFKLIPGRTIFQNVAIRLEIESARPDFIGKKVRYILKRVGLDGRENAYPKELSGGEQQRVAIARAIVGDPVLVLADEPTGNLDTALSLDILTLFREINESGATLLLATHSRELLENTAKRIIKLDQGRLAAS